MFKVGEKVAKESAAGGYSFAGTVVAVFETTRGDPKVVVELDTYGVLHIFAPHQLLLKE